MKSLFFSIPGYEHIRDALIERLDGELGEVERRCFADGEHYQRGFAIGRGAGRDPRGRYRL